MSTIIMKIVVRGIPEAWSRPRPGRNGGWYSPHKDSVWYKQVYWEAVKNRPGQPLLGALGVKMEIVFPKPKKSLPGKNWPIWKVSRPDLDNLQKVLLDAGSDAKLWYDDALVVDIHATKRYADEGESSGAIIKIWRLQENF